MSTAQVTSKTTCPSCGAIHSRTGRIDRRKDKKQPWTCHICGHDSTLIRFIQETNLQNLYERFVKIVGATPKPSDMFDVLDWMLDLEDEELIEKILQA